MKKYLVIYHAKCTDGFGAALAAYLRFGDKAEYFPCAYGQVKSLADIGKLPELEDRDVYVMDFSFPPEVMSAIIDKARYVVWLDHHQSAIEDWCGKDYLTERRQLYVDETEYTHIVLDNRKSGAVLSWEYFHPDSPLPPLFSYIQDRDLWAWKLPRTRDVMAAIRTYPENFEVWEHFLSDRSLDTLLREGVAINRLVDDQLQEISAQAIKVNTGMAMAVVCNAPGSLASELGNTLLEQHPDCLLAVTWYMSSEPGKLGVSFRSRKNGFNCADFARHYGGGGHQGAAGCQWSLDVLTAFLESAVK